MLKEIEIPKDNELMKEKYDNRCCGQSCLAILEKTTIEEIMKQWIDLFGEFKGYSPLKDMVTFLKNKGYLVKRKRLIESSNFIYIARVQWIGEGKKKDKPYYGWNSWYEASNHTHFIILIQKEKTFFCNSKDEWKNLWELPKYLDEGKGIITSFLEIKK